MKTKLYIMLLVSILVLPSLKAQYVGEIRMFAGNFAPIGWVICDGQSLTISENETLFNLIGTTYGGDGQNSFNVPDFRGRAPMHQGAGYQIGEMAGQESVTLTANQIPAHSHSATLDTQINNQGGKTDTPVGNYVAVNAARGQEFSTTSNGNMAGTLNYTTASTTTPIGGNLPHDNMKPYLVINYIISLYGVFPAPN